MKIFELKRVNETANYFEITKEVFENLSRRQIKEVLKELENNCRESIYEHEYAQFVFDKHEINVFHRAEYLSDIGEIAETIQSINVLISEEQKSPIAILNTTILTVDGEFELKTISLDEAKAFIEGKEIVSHVGHDSTAKALTDLFEREVAYNRDPYYQRSGEQALCLKIRGRLEAGQDVDWETVEKIGYDFKLLTMK